MSEQLKNLRETLDNITFKDFDFDEDKRKKVHQKYLKRSISNRSNLLPMIRYTTAMAACLSLTLVIVYFFTFSGGITNSDFSFTSENEVLTINKDNPEITLDNLIKYRKAVKQDIIKTANVDFTNYVFATTEYIYEKKPELLEKTHSLGGMTKWFYYLDKTQTNAIVIRKELNGTNNINFYEYNSNQDEWRKTDYKRVEGKKVKLP